MGSEPCSAAFLMSFQSSSHILTACNVRYSCGPPLLLASQSFWVPVLVNHCELCSTQQRKQGCTAEKLSCRKRVTCSCFSGPCFADSAGSTGGCCWFSEVGCFQQSCSLQRKG